MQPAPSRPYQTIHAVTPEGFPRAPWVPGLYQARGSKANPTDERQDPLSRCPALGGHVESRAPGLTARDSLGCWGFGGAARTWRGGTSEAVWWDFPGGPVVQT